MKLLLNYSCVIILLINGSTLFGQHFNKPYKDLQMEVEDLRQKVKCFELEKDLFDEKVDKLEATLSKLQKDISSHASSDLNQNKVVLLEKKISALEQKNEALLADLKMLQNQTNTALQSITAFKGQVTHLEDSLNHNTKHLKSAIETIAHAMQSSDSSLDIVGGLKSSEKTYKVKSGDTLEKIAKNFGIKVEHLKKLNHLTKDRINIGQELVIGE